MTWTNIYDLLDSESRIMYVAGSSGGNDTTAQIYSISDPEIGSSPEFPTGTIYPYETWEAAYSNVRANKKDCVLFARGSTFELRNGLISHGQNFIPIHGPTADPISTIIGSYGSTAKDRPLITSTIYQSLSLTGGVGDYTVGEYVEGYQRGGNTIDAPGGTFSALVESWNSTNKQLVVVGLSDYQQFGLSGASDIWGATITGLSSGTEYNIDLIKVNSDGTTQDVTEESIRPRAVSTINTVGIKDVYQNACLGLFSVKIKSAGTDDRTSSCINISGSKNIYIEDCTIEGGMSYITYGHRGGYISHPGNIHIYRSIIVDASKRRGGHNQGMFLSGVLGITLEECVMDRNGYSENPTDPRTWSQPLQTSNNKAANAVETGVGVQPHRTWFSRNIYASSYKNLNLKGNILSRSASSHQMRNGGVAERNAFLWNDSALAPAVLGAREFASGINLDRNLVMHEDHLLASALASGGMQPALGGGNQLIATENIFSGFIRPTRGLLSLTSFSDYDIVSRGLTTSLIGNNKFYHQFPVGLPMGIDAPSYSFNTGLTGLEDTLFIGDYISTSNGNINGQKAYAYVTGVSHGSFAGTTIEIAAGGFGLTAGYTNDNDLFHLFSHGGSTSERIVLPAEEGEKATINNNVFLTYNGGTVLDFRSVNPDSIWNNGIKSYVGSGNVVSRIDNTKALPVAFTTSEDADSSTGNLPPTTWNYGGNFFNQSTFRDSQQTPIGFRSFSNLSDFQVEGWEPNSVEYPFIETLGANLGWQTTQDAQGRYAWDRDIVSYMQSIDGSYTTDENVTVDYGVPAERRRVDAIKVWELLAGVSGGITQCNADPLSEEDAKLTARRYHAFLTFIDRARQNNRYNWDEKYTADSLNDYMRSGLSMDIVSGTEFTAMEPEQIFVTGDYGLSGDYDSDYAEGNVEGGGGGAGAYTGENWSPHLLLSSLIGWWDASDSSTLFDNYEGGTLPQDNENVLRFEDKTFNSIDFYPFTEFNSNLQPPLRLVGEYNGLDCLQLSNTVTARPLLHTTTLESTESYLAFHTATSEPWISDLNKVTVISFCPSGFENILKSLGYQLSTQLNLSFDSTNISGLYRFGDRNGSSSPITISNSGTTSGIYCLSVERGVTNNIALLRMNGLDAATSDLSGITFDDIWEGNSRISVGVVGNVNDTSNNVSGSTQIFGEMFVFSDAGITNIEKAEGYLAHKWGVESSLPESHPYATSPPLSGLCDVVSVIPTQNTIGASGGTGSFTVDIGSLGCTWSASTTEGWITLNVSEGTGDGNVEYTIIQNVVNEQRIGEIYVDGFTHTVIQQASGGNGAGVTCEVLGLSPNQSTFGYTGGTFEFSINMSDEGCSWSATTTAPWIELNTSFGTGDADLYFTVNPNTVTIDRSSRIVINNEIFHTVLQLASEGQECEVVSINPTSATADSSGSTGTFFVDMLEEGCTWNATSGVTWITLDVASGTGDGNVEYTVDSASTKDPRTGEIYIDGFTHTILQAGIPCEVLTINPTSATADSSGSTGTFTVDISTEGCTWNATSGVTWITLDVSSGTGDGSIEYTVDPSPTKDPRTGEIYVGGLTHTIIQDGVPCEVSSISPTSATADSSGSTGTFAVDMSAEGCTWNATSGVTWITLDVASGTGDGNVEYTVDPASSKDPRTGEIYLGGFTHTITQDGVPCEVVTINPVSSTVGATQGIQKYFTVNMSAEGCTWNATSSVGWIQLLVSSGEDGQSVVYRATNNNDNNPRVGEIYVDGLTHTVTQAGIPCEVLSINPTSSTIIGAGATSSFSIDMSAEGCTWNVTSGVTWITLDVASGTGDGNVEYTVDVNPNNTPRSGEIYAGGFTHTVNQSAAICEVLSITPTSATADSSGSTGTFFVDMSAEGCTWNVTSGVTWITLDVASGTGDGNVEYSVDTNPNNTSRAGEIYVGGLTYAVTQEGSACEVLSITPTSATADSSGSTGTFAVDMSAEGCTWNATSGVTWITLDVASGTGDGNVEYTVDPTIEKDSRVGEIYLSGFTHTITQEGVACEVIGVSPLIRSIPSSGGTALFTVDMSAEGCTWSATTGNTWITLDVASGTGDGNVDYTVDSNASPQLRTGLITVGGYTHTVRQAGASCETLLIDPETITIGATGTTGTFFVDMSNEGCTWSATTGNTWITLDVASGTGDGYVTYTIPTNDSTYQSRTGEIYLDGFTHSILQLGVVCQVLSITPTSVTSGNTGSTGSFSVDISTEDCYWSATTDEDWITLDVASGTGDGNVEYTIAENDTLLERVGEINVDGIIHTITQDADTCEFTVSTNLPTGGNYVGWTGGTYSISITASNQGCSWEIDLDEGLSTPDVENYFTLSVTSGIGDATVDIYIEDSDTVLNRFAIYDIEGTILVVNQDPVSARLISANPDSVIIGATGVSGNFFSMTTIPDIGTNFFAGSTFNGVNYPWITVNTPTWTGQTSPIQIYYDVEENTSAIGRTGTIAVSRGSSINTTGNTLEDNIYFTIEQDGVACEVVSVSPTSGTAESSGSTGSFSVFLSAAECGWTATSGVTWIALDVASGTGDGTVEYTVDPTIEKDSRVGEIYIDGLTYTVTQDGVPCEVLSIVPSSQTIGSSGSTGSFSVDMSAEGCTWNVTSGVTWIDLIVPLGVGDQDVVFSVDPNIEKDSRVGEIYVGGLTHTITQAGIACEVLLISPTTYTIDSSGSTGTFFVDMSAEGCTWNATSGVTWITLDVASGTGDGNVEYTVDPAPDENPRTGEIYLSGFTHTITQEGIQCEVLSINPTSITADALGSTGSFSVDINLEGCTWNATSGVTWITLDVASGTGDGNVEYTVDPTNTKDIRTGEIYVDGLTHTVNQTGLTCETLSINPSTSSFGSTGTGLTATNFSVNLSTEDCPWTASTSANWITISNDTGTGDSNINFLVGENPSREQRTGYINVDGFTHTVNQEGVVCEVLSLSSYSYTALPTGSSNSFIVNLSGIDCPWEATTNQDWILITQGLSSNPEGDISNTRVTYEIEENISGSLRTGYVNVGGLTHTITQDNLICEVVSVTPDEASIPAAGATFHFNVDMSGQGCPWLATTSSDWIQFNVNSGTGDAEVFYTVDRNLLKASRIATIDIDGTSHIVRQAGASTEVVSVFPQSQNFFYSGGTGSFILDTRNEFSTWSVNRIPSWVTLNVSSGTGDTVITYTVDPNPSTTPRTGIIDIEGILFNVKQFGGPEEPDTTSSSYYRQPDSQNYIYQTYFRFSIFSMPKLEYFITKVNLPSFGYDSSIEQPNRFSLIKHPANKVVFSPLEMDFLVDENMQNWLEISNWIRRTSVVDDHSDIIEDTKEHFTQGTLFITNSAMNPNLEVTFYNMFPISITGFEFDSSVTELTPWTSTVTFAYDWYEVKKL